MTQRANPSAPPGPAAAQAPAAPEASPAHRPGGVAGFYRKNKKTVHLLVSIAIAASVWQVAAQFTSPLILVPLESIYGALVRRIEGGQFWQDLAVSARAFATGLLLASLAGVLLGIAMATSELIHDLFDPWVAALYSTPLIALAPLFIIIFGIGVTSKVAVVFLLAVFPVLINTTAGIRTAERHLIEGAYSFGATQTQIFTKVLIPSAIPFIVTGIRLAIGRGLVAVVVAEFFGARSGIGAMIFHASQRFDASTVWLGVFILATIGTISLKAMQRLERRLAPWREFRMP